MQPYNILSIRATEPPPILRDVIRSLAICASFFVAIFFFPTGLLGDTFTGNSTNDSVAGSLKQTIIDPNPSPSKEVTSNRILGDSIQTNTGIGINKAEEAITADYLTTPLAFETNTGQTDTQVDYLSRGSGYSVFLCGGDAVLVLQGGETGHTVRLNLVGGRRAAAKGENLLDSYSNYFIGNDSAAWKTGVLHYAAVEYESVYHGIDLRYYGNQRQLEYDFIVDVGADASQIRLEFTGVTTASIADNHDLLLTLNEQGRQIVFKAPVAYQSGPNGRMTVQSQYLIHDDGSIGFELGDYDANRKLVIDPTLNYVTFLGGTGYDTAEGIAVDSSGSVYITGMTASTDFPTTMGAYNGGSYDIFVANLSTDGNSLVYSTFIGGLGYDAGHAIAVDSSGNVYVAGETTSTDLPTVNAYQSTLKGIGDGVLLKLNSTGTGLLYSTYFGGTSATWSDVAYDLALDASNIVYLAGKASSSDMPLKNAYDATLEGTYDAFVAKFDLSQTGADSLLYSTFFGGSGDEYANTVAVDSTGAFVIAGNTTSSDITTLNAYQPAYGLSTDAFVTRFNSSGSALTYSTYLGGNTSNYAEVLAIDSSGKIYVGGRTSGTFPTTVGAYTEAPPGGSADGFVSKIDPTLSGAASLIYSTYLGSTVFDYVIGLDVDSAGVAYITGFTSSPNFPKTADAAFPNMTGSNDGFFATLNAAGSSLIYSTFLGGTGQDRGLDVVWSVTTGSAYVAGHVGATDWPSSPTPTHFGPEGDKDAFVAKFTFPRPTISSGDNKTYRVGFPATAIRPITVTDDVSSPQITAANDIRIHIPSGFNMSWDTSDTAASIGGSAAAKVSSSVSYEDSARTLVINVLTDFSASDQITIADLSFNNFTATSPADHLELEVDSGGTVAALDDKTITIGTPPDIAVDGDFSDWCDGDGTEFCVNDQGGQDDYNSPAKLDVTLFGLSSNLSDSFFLLFGFDDVVFSNPTTAATLIDTDLDGFINFAVVATTDAVSHSVQLYSCNDSISYGCDEASLEKTYDASDFSVGTGTGPWNTDTFVEINIPFSDLGMSGGDSSIFTSLVSYAGAAFLKSPKDSIFGSDSEDYDDRIVYDGEDGGGEIVPNPTTPSISGTVYADEGITPLSGKIVQLLINGVTVDSAVTNANGDYFIIDPTITSGSLLVYIDNDAVYQGTTATVFDGTTLSDLNIYGGHIITRNDDGGSMTNVNMAAAKGASSDSDILYSVTGGALTVSGSTTELFVPSGHSFVPGGDVTCPNMESQGTFNGAAVEITVNGELTISGGSFTASSNNMTLSGDFTHSAGTFSHNSGTIILNGSNQRISGSTSFHSFYKSVSSVDTLTVEAGSTQSFTGTVTVEGVDGNLLRLRSSNPGTRWNFTLMAGATASIRYIDLQDSDASGSDSSLKPVNPRYSLDSGNTIDWFFYITISSAARQNFVVGSGPAAISPITITEDSTGAAVTAANDIRIRIPDRLYMLWDTSDTSAVITGSAAGKVSTTVNYEDSGKTLVINVTSDFAADDSITISGLSFSNFTASSYSDNLELEVGNDGRIAADDEKRISIGGLPAAGSVLVYGQGNEITPRFRTWDGTAFSLESTSPDTDDVISWAVLKASPVTYEMILGVYSSQTSTLYIQTWDGTSWGSNWSLSMNLSANYRGFDIAYERNSGDVVVIFCDASTNALKYRKRIDGVWDASAQSITTLDDDANWVRAESRPGSDDIFVAAQSNAKSVYALRWDGTADSWGDQVLASTKVRSQNTEAIEIAFEQASGDAFLLWGDDANTLKYRQFTTSWQGEATAYSGLSDDVLFLAADYDPSLTGSSFAVGMVLNNTTFEFGAWNGTSWESRPAAIAAVNKDQRGIDVQFNPTSGQAMYVFNQNANARQLAWRIWSSGGCDGECEGNFGAVTVESGTTSADINFMQLKANPRGDDMMAIYVDNNADLFHRYWNGSTWSALASTLQANISDADKNEVFMFAWKTTSPATAVDLISFTAEGSGDSVVVVSWETAQESKQQGLSPVSSRESAGVPGAG